READSVPLLSLAADHLIRRAMIQLESPDQLARFNTHAVVADIVLDTIRRLFSADLDARIRLVPDIFAGVAEQILEYVVDLLLFRTYRRQIANNDLDSLALDNAVGTRDCVANDRFDVHQLATFGDLACYRRLQEIPKHRSHRSTVPE